MRCLACNVILDDDETEILFTGSTEYVDLCTDCLDESDIFEDYEDEGFVNDNRTIF